MNKETKNKREEQRQREDAVQISDRVLDAVFKYRPTTEDLAIKKLLVALNY